MSAEVMAVPGLESLPLVVALRDSAALYSLVETVHLVGVALLVGPVVAFDLRVLGLNRRLHVDAFARHLLPIAVGSLVLIVPSGLAMFAVNAGHLLASGGFMVKMALIVLSGVLAVLFHAGPYRQVTHWHAGRAPTSARVLALASLSVWLVVVWLGAGLRPPF